MAEAYVKGCLMNKDRSDRVDHSGRLLSVEGVAELLDISKRHVYRLSDAGKMPRPLKLGGAVRWDRQSLERWIAAGCRPIS